MKNKIMIFTLLILVSVILAACSNNIVREYTLMCKENDFTKENLEKVVLNLDKINWREYLKASRENEYFISVFWKLEDYSFDKNTMSIVLKLRESNSSGLDGGLSEEYMGLVEYLYKSDKYKDIVIELEKEDPIIAETIKIYRDNYEQ